ncbi:MAG TPA: urate oxidase, partial [Jatrophihabitans sp.]|nr:urate oxidase [Jatrophihabitans sp.]
EPGFTRTATVVTDRQQGRLVLAGLRDLTLLNTTRSEFAGFARDRYTTLPETADRVLATSVTARWSYREPGTHDWAGCFDRARTALVEAFADTYSHSLQQTLYAMGERVLRALPEADQVRLVLPNRHHFLVDLQPFGLANENEVYLAADRPYGVIEGAVLADDAVPGGQLPWD